MTFDQRLLVALFLFFFVGVAVGAVALWIRNNAAKEKTMSFKLELGTKVTDKITGYTGQIIGRTEWLYACRRYVIQARELKDGKPVEAINCDEDQLEVVEEPAEKHVMKSTGGPTREAPRPRETTR